MDFHLKGKVAIVTGAGRGIGRGIAQTLAAEGARVAVNDFYLDRAETVVGEIIGAGGEATAIQADVTNLEQITQVVEKLFTQWGAVDILVNNAGIPAGTLENSPASLMKTFMEMSREDWDKWIQLDLVGTLNCCKAVLTGMARQKYGKIINIISDAGRVGEPRQAVYSGVKAGIVGFSKALAKEMAQFGVNVNCVAPSATTGTYLSDLMGTESPKNEEERERLNKIMKFYPLARARNRLGRPADLANAVTFLASDLSEWITGQVLSVNGGYCMVD